MHRKKLTGPTESNLVLHTWAFQPGDRASHVFLNLPLSKAINATGYLEPAWMMWLSPWSPLSADPLSYYNFTLPVEFLPPSSFLSDDPCWYACYYLCWHFLLFTYMSQKPHVDPGAWSKVFHPLTGIECLLPVEYSRSLELYTERSDMEQNYTSEGADRAHCNGLRP